MNHKNIRFGYWINEPFRGGGPADALEQGILAEKSGFDSVWIGDHYMSYAGQFSETFTILTAIGMRTKRVIVSPAVTDPLRRHPATIAQTIASIDQLTGGRASLGIGAGEAINLIPFGIKWKKPVSTLREAIAVIKKLWLSSSDERCSYDGEFFHLKDAFVKIKPVQFPHPPIYVGALRERTRELTGELADGYFPWINSAETYKERLKEIEKGAKKVGRSLKDIDKVAVLPLSTSDYLDEAKRAVEQYSKCALILEKDILKHYGYEILTSKNLTMQFSLFTTEDLRILEETLKEVPIDVVEKISAVGTVEDCINKIDEFIKAGADHIVILNYSPDPYVGMKVLREEIIPYFKET